MLGGFSLFGANKTTQNQQEAILQQVKLVQAEYQQLITADAKFIGAPAAFVTLCWVAGQCGTITLAVAYGCLYGFSKFYPTRQQQADSLYRELSQLLDLYRSSLLSKEPVCDEATTRMMEDTLSCFIADNHFHPPYLRENGWQRLLDAIKTESNLFVYGAKPASLGAVSLSFK